jgi:predicted nucleic acid-binding protein
LVLIGEVGLLPRIFGKVLVPYAVTAELSHLRTPPAVREFLSTDPPWLHVMPTQPVANLPLQQLGDGERATIALAISVGAASVLMDDRAAVAAARTQGLVATGTLGVLNLAAHAGLVDLAASFAQLRLTNFRCRRNLMDDLLAINDPNSERKR